MATIRISKNYPSRSSKVNFYYLEPSSKSFLLQAAYDFLVSVGSEVVYQTPKTCADSLYKFLADASVLDSDFAIDCSLSTYSNGGVFLELFGYSFEMYTGDSFVRDGWDYLQITGCGVGYIVEFTYD